MTATGTRLARGLVRTGAIGALIAAALVAAAPASAHHKPGHHKGPPHGQVSVVHVHPQPVYVAPAPVTVMQPAPVVIEDCAPQRAHQHLVAVGIDRHLVRIALAHDHVAAGRAAVVDEAMARLLPGREAGVVARLHRVAFRAEPQGERAVEDIDMLLLEDVVMRRRALPARRQLLDRDAHLIRLAHRREAEVLVAHREARHVRPFGPRHVLRGDGLHGHGRVFGHDLDLRCKNRASHMARPCQPARRTPSPQGLALDIARAVSPTHAEPLRLMQGRSIQLQRQCPPSPCSRQPGPGTGSIQRIPHCRAGAPSVGSGASAVFRSVIPCHGHAMCALQRPALPLQAFPRRTLPDLLDRARVFGLDRPILVTTPGETEGQEILRYGAFLERVAGAALALGTRFAPGSRIACMLGNSADYFILRYALSCAGLVEVETGIDLARRPAHGAGDVVAVLEIALLYQSLGGIDQGLVVGGDGSPGDWLVHGPMLRCHSGRRQAVPDGLRSRLVRTAGIAGGIRRARRGCCGWRRRRPRGRAGSALPCSAPGSAAGWR